jgi:transposase
LAEDVLVAKGYRPVVRDQPFLFPPDMREWLPPDHPVWTVIAIVGRLDTSAFHQCRRVGGVGRAGYDPDMLLTLLIWAWSQGLRSSRRIERACSDVVSYRVICAGDVPDHTTIARFRAGNHAVCEQLFSQVLVLAAQLGLGRLETVALDGVKIASNASLAANRTAAGLARAAEKEAARIAARVAAEHAVTDAEEDKMYGADNPELVPAELADEAVRAARIDEAIAALNTQTTADPEDRDKPAGPDDVRADGSEESAESGEPQRVPRDRSARIGHARARIEAEIAAERAQQEAAAREYLQRIDAGEKVGGRPPVGTLVGLAERALANAIAASQAKHDRWAALQAGSAAGRRSGGRRPVPVEQNARVRQQQARLDKARAAEAARAEAARAVERMANITDPQSRMQPLRGGGWLQGYNCQAVTAADGLIVATGAGTSPVDYQYYREMVEKAVAAAELIVRHRPADPSGRAAVDESIGIVLSDAGYCSRENLTAPGPDRLIATGKSRDLHAAASRDPAQGPPPDEGDPIAAMAHRLRTRQGMATYAQRSHIAETPFGHAKHNLNFRQFTSRGLARARSEWDFHAAVHNIGKVISHLAGTPLPA